MRDTLGLSSLRGGKEHVANGNGTLFRAAVFPIPVSQSRRETAVKNNNFFSDTS